MYVLTVFFILVLDLRINEAVINYLNESQYSRMPPLFGLDDYSSCVGEEGGVYCLVDGVLTSKKPSQLLELIQEYSSNEVRHYNHTQIHRGICYSKCRRSRRDLNNRSTDFSLDKCLNETIFHEYDLEVHVSKVEYCVSKDSKPNLDALDITVATIYLLLLVLNLWGTLYDVFLTKNDEKNKGNKWLLTFSMRRNWRKLTQEAQNKDPRMDSFKAIHGLRAMTLCCVIFSHTVLIMAFSYVENPLYVETGYDDPLKQLLYNGSLVVQTFFTLSAFLLSYNFLILLEKKPLGLWHYPKGILNRWLRLTPLYLLIMATIQTWMSRLGDGPLWQHIVGTERDACRQHWWLHLLYVNNYSLKDIHCMPQTWYLAADMQLFVWGLALCMLASRTKKPFLVWGIASFVALLPPAIHTYIDDLDAVVIQTPESCRTIYGLARDIVFRTVYIPGHTNAAGFTLALAGAALFYKAQKDGYSLKGNKLFLALFYVTFPLGTLTILSGGVWYTEDRISLWPRLLYATFYKPVFALLLLIFLFGVFMNVESLYRGIISARHWRILGRVSYCGFLLHTLVQRPLYAIYSKPIQMTDYHIMLLLAASIMVTFILAIPLAIMVEMPLSHLQKLILNPTRGETKDKSIREGAQTTHTTNGHLHAGPTTHTTNGHAGSTTHITNGHLHAGPTTHTTNGHLHSKL